MNVKAHNCKVKTMERYQPIESKLGRMAIPKEEINVGARTKNRDCSTYGMSRTFRQGTDTASASRLQVKARIFALKGVLEAANKMN